MEIETLFQFVLCAINCSLSGSLRAGAEARPYEKPEGMSLAEFRCRSSERQFKRFLPRRVRGKKHFSAHKRARFARALQ